MRKDISVQRNELGIYFGKLFPILIILIGVGIMVAALGLELLGYGDQTGIGPNQVMAFLTGLIMFLSGLAITSSARYRYIIQWLVVGTATIAVVTAADLIDIIGQPNLGVKLLLLPVVAFAVALISYTPTTPSGSGSLNQWLMPLTLNNQLSIRFLIVAIQLALLVVVINQYDLESQAFSQNIMVITFYGFVVHFFLPPRYRLPFFSMLSLAVILGVFGFPNGMWLIGIGLGLIGICHLPIRYIARVGLLLVAAALLVAFRAEWFHPPWSSLIWPILGSMFMFRLIAYVKDLNQQKDPVNIWRTLSYFFLYPNVVFPFFPVVSHSAFRRTYYDVDQYQIYQTGLKWMLRGVIQLLLYRFISYYLVIAPEDVANTSDLVRFLITNFALYLRVSGLFHLIIGILHLFGFNLPETNHLYFLASNFTDLWRRINIYWKDFMLWNFFYPTYFRVRHWGATLSLVAVTAFIFLLTWFFHAYQWFWLRGSFLLSAQDMLFWAILAVLVIINSLFEAKKGRKRSLGQQNWTLRDLSLLTFRTAGTFSLMAILWSLWTADSLRSWISLWDLPEVTRIEMLGGLILAFIGLALVFGVVIWIEKRSEEKKGLSLKQGFSFKPAMVNAGMILFIALIGSPIVYSKLPGGQSQEVVRDLTVSRLNARDAALLQRGYYENLIGVNRFNSQLWEIYMDKPENTGLETTRLTGDFIKEEVKPLMAETYQGGLSFRTNRWGMRDKYYEKLPPPNTHRIAVVGPSTVMGWGVADDETFESILEEQLNQETGGRASPRYEVLNFGVPDYSVFQSLMALENKVFDFKPNVVFYIANQYDEGIAIKHLAERFLAGVDIPYSYLKETANKAGVGQGMSQLDAEKRLKPFGAEMISWAYHQIVEQSRAQGVLPVWVFMPTPEIDMPEENIAMLKQLAEESGFVVLNLSDVFDGQDIPTLWLAEWDHHPNAMGHELLAESLYKALLDDDTILPFEPAQ